MATEIEKFAKTLAESFKGKGKSLADFFTEDAVYTAGGPARGSRYEGIAAVRGAMNRANNQVFLVEKMDFKHVLAAKDVVTGKDFVVVPISVKGKSRITSRDYANELCLLLEVKDGKIVHMHEYLDTIASARANAQLPYPD